MLFSGCGWDEMLGEVEGFCKKNHLAAAGDFLLLACSGGPDSLALLHVFLRLREKWQFRLCCVHFEHGIRAEASKEDAAFVADFCERHAVDFRMEAADVPGWAAQHHMSLETAARELRYAFFRRVCDELGADAIATAHHADDQAETVLMHLLRGTGPEGLAGMLPRRGRLIRPFLGLRRVQIEAYCARYGLAPRHDVTNDLADCTRNRLRLELLPELRRTFNPEITAALCRLAAVMKDEDDYLQQMTEQLAQELVLHRSACWELGLPAYRSLQPALQRRLLRWIFSQCTAAELGFVHLESLRELIRKGSAGKALDLPGNVRAELSYETLTFWGAHQQRMQSGLPVCMPLQIPGDTVFADGKTVLRAEFVPSVCQSDGRHEVFWDFDLLPPGLCMRTRKAGDRLFIGSGTKKLKDFFVDAKVPRGIRAELPLVCAAQEVLWIVGWRPSVRARVHAGTKRILHLSLLEMINKDKRKEEL